MTFVMHEITNRQILLLISTELMSQKIRMISICGNFCIERRFVHFCRFRHRAHVCQKYNSPESQTNESVVQLQEFFLF